MAHCDYFLSASVNRVGYKLILLFGYVRDLCD